MRSLAKFGVIFQLAFVMVCGGAAASTDSQAPTPVGVWLHANKRIELEIAPCGKLLCGKLIWFARPNDALGRPLEDVKNPDPSLRNRPLLGLPVLSGLTPAGHGEWNEGEIYNPDDGKSYQALASVEGDGTLHTRAYVVLPVLGKTLVWTRVR
jgi:uncharacterized protein (DUF2147 family)